MNRAIPEEGGVDITRKLIGVGGVSRGIYGDRYPRQRPKASNWVSVAPPRTAVVDPTRREAWRDVQAETAGDWVCEASKYEQRGLRTSWAETAGGG